MMCDEQWSEWIEWPGGGDCPIEVGVAHQVRLRDGGERYCDDSSFWDWRHFGEFEDITHYRCKISIEEAMNNAATGCVFGESSVSPYDAYTTDELVHAVRGMREEIKRRCA